MTYNPKDPCWCMSGKKGKKCHKRGPNDVEEKIMLLRKACVYQSAERTGGYRRVLADFKEALKPCLEKAIKEYGNEPSCKQGCSNCCSQYITVSISEADSVLHFLAENPDVFARFKSQYGAWKSRMDRTLFSRLRTGLAEHWVMMQGLRHFDSQMTDTVDQLARDYLKQDVSCPFLFDNECGIYKVRPTICAGNFAFDDPIQCKGDATVPPRALMIVVPPTLPLEQSFLIQLPAIRDNFPTLVHDLSQNFPRNLESMLDVRMKDLIESFDPEIFEELRKIFECF